MNSVSDLSQSQSPIVVGIIILNYNTSDDCRKCISYIKSQTGIETEIIVVDNCSQKADVDKLSEFCDGHGITLLNSKENRGYSAGNNIGLRYAVKKGIEYALIINPDVEIHQNDYLQRAVKQMISDNTIAVLGTDILHVNGKHQNPLREPSFFDEFFWPCQLLKSVEKKERLYIEDYSHSRYCTKLSGCCFMIKLSFAQQIGFLDETTFLYCEEPILAKQVQQNSLKMYYISNLQAFHNHIKSKKGDPQKRMRFFAESRNYYLKTYSGHSYFTVRLLRFSRLAQSFLYRLLKK